MKTELTTRRTIDYLTLQWLLLLFILGGLITLNCNPAEDIAGGTLKEEEGISKVDEAGGIQFDSDKVETTATATYTLPPTMKVYFDDETTVDRPIQWEVATYSAEQNRATINGNVATVNYPNKPDKPWQFVTFSGYYEDAAGDDQEVEHTVRVKRTPAMN